MKIDGQEIPAKEYTAPAVHAVKTFFRRLIKIIGWGILGIIALFILWRTLPAAFFNLTSRQAVVINIGAGGFNNPEKYTYWSNGWSIYQNRAGDFWSLILYSVSQHNATDVQRLAEAISRVSQAQISATPCEGFTLDAPDVTYTAVQQHVTFSVSGSHAGCYDTVLHDVDQAYYELVR